MSDWKDRNQEHFDATADDYDQRFRADEMTTKGANAIIEAYKAVNPNLQEARAFEFGIGTGLVAVKVAPSIKSVFGVDISEQMLKQVQKKLEDPAHAAVASKIKTVQHLVTKDDPLPAPYKDDVVSAGGQGFDLVYTSMVMHHVEDAVGTIKMLVEHFTKKGSGWFFMIDIQWVEGISERWHQIVSELFHAPKEGGGEGQHQHHHHHHHHHHGQEHGHGHQHGQEHAHGHQHGQEHAHGHQHGHGHAHGQEHGHGHAHGHGHGKAHEVADIVPHDSGFKDDDLRRYFADAGLVDVFVKTGFTMEFFVPSMNKTVPFQYVLAGGRRA